MKNKVYIVHSYFADYQCYDSYTCINGVFDNPFDAEKLKKSILVKNDLIKSIPCPPNKNEDYVKWVTQQEEAEALKSVIIKEYELNQLC